MVLAVYFASDYIVLIKKSMDPYEGFTQYYTKLFREYYLLLKLLRSRKPNEASEICRVTKAIVSAYNPRIRTGLKIFSMSRKLT